MILKNKIALITGGTRGIGKAVAIRFAKEGAKVIVNGYDKDEFENSSDLVVNEILNNGGEAISIDCDISDKKKVSEMFNSIDRKYGKIDILVANAGICPFKNFLEIEEDMLNNVIDVNQKGAFYCAQESMRRMIKKDIKGRLIFTSSVSSIFGGELQSHYSSTKGAINQLMKSIAISAGKYGITSNAVLPGTILTDINKKELESDPDLLNYFIKRTPIGRLATPEDIAYAMLFFASDESSGISGTTLTVDGGMSINLQ